MNERTKRRYLVEVYFDQADARYRGKQKVGMEVTTYSMPQALDQVERLLWQRRSIHALKLPTRATVRRLSWSPRGNDSATP